MRCAVQNLLGAAAILAVAGCTRPPSPGALVPAAVANDIAAGEWAPDQTEFNFPLATGSTVTELLDIDPSEGEVVFSQAGDSWAIVGATTARVVVQGATHSVPIGPETTVSFGHGGKHLCLIRQVRSVKGIGEYEYRVVDYATGFEPFSRTAMAIDPILLWTGERAYFTALKNGPDAFAQRLYQAKPGEEPFDLGPSALRLGSPAAPSLSPSGSKIVWFQGVPGNPRALELVVLAQDSTAPRRIRRVDWSQGPYTWSVDETAIAYLSQDGDHFEFHKIRIVDGVEEVTPFRLEQPKPTEAAFFSQPQIRASHISPDLKRCLIYAPSTPVYSRDIDTGRQSPITSGPANPLLWKPTSDIVFVSVKSTYRGHSRYYGVEFD